jgi:integrase
VQIAQGRGDDALAQAIELSAYSGLRQGEARRLHVDDVDWRNNVLLVGGTVDTRTKGRNYREVPIHPRLKPLLKSRTGTDRGYHDIIFDEFPNQWNLHRRWKHVLRIANREDRTITEQHYWKTLRNSFITWALDDGVPSMKVKGWAGHSSITVTEGYYSQNNDQDHDLMSQL